MEKQKTRSEIDDKYKWDLTTIYKTEEILKKDLLEVEKELEHVNSYKGKIVVSAKNLYTYLCASDELERKIYKLYYYAHLKHDEDTTNAKNQELLGTVTNIMEAALFMHT